MLLVGVCFVWGEGTGLVGVHGPVGDNGGVSSGVWGQG